MDRIRRGALSTISVTLYDGETATDSSTAVTIQVLRADGTVAVAAGTATTKPAGTTGLYEFAITPAVASLVDVLTATWSATLGGVAQTFTTQVEVAGGFYVTIAELRALPNLSDTAKFTTAELRAARAWFEDKFELYTGVAWVVRYGSERLDGTSTASLLLPHQQIRSVRSVRTYTDATTYTAYTAGELADLRVRTWGAIERGTLGTFAYGSANLLVDYEHGYEHVPADVVEAAKVGIRDKALSDQSGRVYAVQTESGIVRSSTPGPDTPFGLPFVDAVCNARSQRAPAVA